MTYEPTVESLSSHHCPEWFKNAKLGIFIHFGLYSVPAYAPKGLPLGLDSTPEQRYLHNPYAEWYENGLRIKNSETYEHHMEKYGADYPYSRFADELTAESFDADQWMDFFASVHARYIVFTSKHHDGFCMYRTASTEFNSVDKAAHRDFAGELEKACRRKGIRYGLYYSGLLDWTHSTEPILNQESLYHPDHDDEALAQLSYRQAMELIDQYHPDLFWNDISWARKGYDSLLEVLAHYYNTVPEGAIDYRFPFDLHDYYGKEYLFGDVPDGSLWELTRGIGLSFGYNRYEDASNFISVHDLIALLIDTVANHGNLLINTGPRPDGTLDPRQTEVLSGLGKWLDQCGESIFDTFVFSEANQKNEDVTIYGTQTEQYRYYFAVSPRGSEFDMPFSRPAVLLNTEQVEMTVLKDRTHIRLCEPYHEPLVFRTEAE